MPIPPVSAAPPAASRRARLMPLAAIAVAALAAALGFYLRHDLIEPVARAAACAESPAPWWCLARDAIRIGAQNFVIAGMGLIAALASLLYRGRSAGAAVIVAMALGGAGIFLYSTAVAAVAVVIALLRAASLDRT